MSAVVHTWRRVAVEGEGDRSAVAEDDLVAAGQRLAGGRRDQVVLADLQALVGEELPHVVGEGVQGARDAVDGEPHGLVVGDEGAGAAGQEGDDEGLRHEPPQTVAGRAGGLAPPCPAPAAARPCGGTGTGAGGGTISGAIWVGCSWRGSVAAAPRRPAR
ncbi:hypothetical protein Shyd_48010 [Streptomyces hydrogenans]|uniref:Uncharacterized protein n=1 Tax=Streptomyces hydrogenans TaxID=1873719 RepID=A0ABQ3PEI3_9ACTN|nr:hypothetical protein Shyd_48010 [Streptomyces hydrogenans]